MSHWLKAIALFGSFIGAMCAGLAPATAAPGDSIIIIANKTYRSGIAPVEFADRDGDAIEKAAREVLGVDRLGLKRFDNMTVGEAADWFRADGTPGDDLTAFVRRASHGRQDAIVYFYYSGHGVAARNAIRETDELHFILNDTRSDAVGSKGLSIEAVKRALTQVQQAALPKGRVVILIDACFSGFSRDGTEVWKGARAGAVSAVLAAPGRTVLLTAAGPNEPAWSDLNRRHGAFTDALVDGLYGGAADSNGRITAKNLVTFIDRRTTERLSKQARNQTPTLVGDGEAMIAILTSPYPDRDPAARSQEKFDCQYLRAQGLKSDIVKFLGRCSVCECRAELDRRLRDLEEVPARCEYERLRWEEDRRSGDKVKIQWWAMNSRCEAFKRAASALLEDVPARPKTPDVSEPPTSIPTPMPSTSPPCPVPQGQLFSVLGVRPDDVLNMRAAPDPSAAILLEIPHNATGITKKTCANTRNGQWCQIYFGCSIGWVASRYLGAESEAPTYSSADSRRRYKVVGVSADDFLNIRKGPGDLSVILGRIPPDTVGIDVLTCRRSPTSSTEWCDIRYHGLSGWVNKQFLRRTP